MGGNGIRQLPAGLEVEADAVGDVEAGLLAGVLHRPDHLPGQTLGSQFRCDLDVEGDAVRALVLDLVALPLLASVRVSPSTATVTGPPAATCSRRTRISSGPRPARAAAIVGIRGPKRGPSARKLGLTE